MSLSPTPASPARPDIHAARPPSDLASIGGRTPLSVFEEDTVAGDISFVGDHAELDSKFVAHIERSERADATCSVDGVHYEVPQHFRGRKITPYCAVLKPGAFWIEEGRVHVPVGRVDAKANFNRRREAPIVSATDEPRPATRMNAVEDRIRRGLHPTANEADGRDSEDSGTQPQEDSF